MSAQTYTLEHFYYGQAVRAGQPERDLQLLASSPGVKPEQVAEIITLALLPPLSGPHAWALVRGRKTVPFVLAQSQMGEAGNTTLHFVLPPPDMLRAFGGNLKALARLVEEQIPALGQPGGVLKPLTLAGADAPSADMQIDDILRLMSDTRNRIDTIEALLAGVVQGVPVVVIGAPLDLEPRVRFIEGLLALLPSSARFGVTFATHSLASTRMDVQIRFFTGDTPPDDALVFDWDSKQISGSMVDDEYSRFITSLLRLDADLVIRQTSSLTAIAAWRIRLGDRLADALAYAARRFKMDDSLLNNQPVEIAEVSRVLAEDPTLTDELKIAYTRHLLAFSLALGDMEHAEPIAVMLRQQPDLERALQQQFSDAIQEGKAGLVYEALARWLANPLGPVGMKWVELVHRAMLANMDALVKARDVRGAAAFLEAVQNASPGVEVSRVVPRLVELTLPLAVQDPELNLMTFLLAVNYMETDLLRRLIGSQRFIAKLPPGLARVLPYVTGEDAGLAPSGLLMETASAFGDQWRDLVLIRLSELAVRSKRPDLVDTPALSGLVGLLRTPWGIQYSQTLHWIARNLTTDDNLQHLDDPGPTYVLQILLAVGAYVDLANEMLHQARVLYPGDRQTDYIAVVRRLFAETPIPTDELPTALKVIGDTGIKSLPLAMAYIGALEGHEWSSVLDPLAETVTRMIYDNQTILDVIPPTAMIALMKFHIKRRDVRNTVRVARLIGQVSVREGARGINMIGRLHKMMDWDEEVRSEGLNLLRRFVRQAPDEDARRAIIIFGREFGVVVQQALETTYALRRMMDSVTLLDYAEFLHITAEFLYQTALAYADPKKLPSLSTLLNNLDGMPGGLTNDDRKIIMRDLLALGKAIVVLGDHQRANRLRDPDRHMDKLLAGTANPVTPLDVLMVMSGYFTKGKRYPLRLDTVPTLVPYPLGERSAPTLRDEVQIINGLLRSIVRAFPPDQRLSIESGAIRAEVESLWSEMPTGDQREIMRSLAIDLQRVALLTAIIAEGNEKALEDTVIARKLEEGKQQPKNTLEFYRLAYGYFKARVK